MPLLDKGGVFPPEEDQKRLYRYRQNMTLYSGKHWNHRDAKRIIARLQNQQRQVNRMSATSVVNIVVNLPRLTVQKHADLLVLREPLLRMDSDEATATFLEMLVEEIPDWRARLHHWLELKRALGDGLLMPRRKPGANGERGAVDLRVGDPQNWFPVASETDSLEIEFHQMAWVEEHGTAGDTNPYLRVDVYFPDGTIEHKAFQLEGDPNLSEGRTDREYAYHIKESVTLGTFWGGLQEREPAPDGVEGFGIIHTPNGKSDDLHLPFGRSDFEDAGALFDNTNEALSKWARANDKVAQVPRAVPYKYMKTDPVTRETIMPEMTEENFVVSQSGRDAGESVSEMPAWITLDLNHATLQDEFTRSFITTCIRMEMAPSFLGFELGNQKESGEAKSVGQSITLAAAKRDLLVVRPGSEQAMTILAALSGNPGTVTSQWFPGLPKSENETQLEVQLDLNMGIITKREAIKRREPHLTEEQIDVRLEELQEERQQAIKEMPAFADQE